jgi:hypothetical protein
LIKVFIKSLADVVVQHLKNIAIIVIFLKLLISKAFGYGAVSFFFLLIKIAVMIAVESENKLNPVSSCTQMAQMKKTMETVRIACGFK